MKCIRMLDMKFENGKAGVNLKCLYNVYIIKGTASTTHQTGRPQ